MKNKSKIAILIPYYKAANHIVKVITSINDFEDYIESVIIINDKSPDELPLKELQQVIHKQINLVVLNNETNLGVGGATKKGFNYAIQNDFDLVIKMDADNQMDASFLPILIKSAQSNKAQMAKGNRFTNSKQMQKMPFVRRFGNIFLSFLTKIATGYWNNFDPTNGYFAIKTSVLKKIDFDKLANRYFFETSLIAQLYFLNAKIKDISMPPIYANEKSNMKVWKMPFLFLKNLFKIFVKRIIKTYFLNDFNIASLYIFIGLPLFLFGFLFGLFNWYYYNNIKTLAPTGTIMIVTLSIILGFQLILQAIQFDISNAPKSK